MRTAVAAAALLAALSASADAAWLRLGFASQLTQSSNPLNTTGYIPASFGSASGHFTFDTDAAPLTSDGVTLTFAIADYVYNYTLVNSGVTTVRQLNPSNSTARIIYKASNDTLTLQVTRNDNDGTTSSSIVIVDPAGPFNGSMTSLPESGYGAFGNISMFLNENGVLSQALWNASNNTFTAGAVQYNFGFVGAPTPPPCEADIAPPFGALNFFDFSEYLNRFNAGCP